eukprot:TRINITY_DN1465_c0_g1_i1.p2 TRINITY_DN1465_c0_g1~~TRINITY_DN1465_c0_g1_i1.p2  ORF type:complete len:235 (-),score=80.49 TRINITY_DN1465_c0_g1_i1:38-742(-)
MGGWSQDTTSIDTSDITTAESSLVDQLCAQNAVRVNPTRSQLNQFSKSCASMNANAICAQLEAKLRDRNWKIKAKSLCGIQALLSKVDGVEDYFSQGSGLQALNEQLDCVQKSVLDKTNNILSVLQPYIEINSQQDNIFGGLSIEDQQETNANEAEGDMFGGLTVDDEETENENEIFGGLNVENEEAEIDPDVAEVTEELTSFSFIEQPNENVSGEEENLVAESDEQESIEEQE